MNFPLPEISFGHHRKIHWGGLYGSADAWALSQYARTANEPILMIAGDIKASLEMEAALRFYAPKLEIIHFADWEILPYDRVEVHPDITASRLRALEKIIRLKNGVVITTIESALSRLCPRSYIESATLSIFRGMKINPETLKKKLARLGFSRVKTVTESGEFAERGALVDIFPSGSEMPYRIDFFDDTVDTIRTFSPETQRSEKQVDAVSLLPAYEFATDPEAILRFQKNYKIIFGDENSVLYQAVCAGNFNIGAAFYLPLFFDATEDLFAYFANGLIVHFNGFNETVDRLWADFENRYENAGQHPSHPPLEPRRIFLTKSEFFAKLKHYRKIEIQSVRRTQKNHALNFQTKRLPPLGAIAQTPRPLGRLADFVRSFSGNILIVAATKHSAERIENLLSKDGVDLKKCRSFFDFCERKISPGIVIGNLPAGMQNSELAIISEAEIFGHTPIFQKRRRRAKHRDFDESVKNLVELRKNDAVVHERYGVGRYRGLKTQTVGGVRQDFIVIEYAGAAKLLVPVTALDLISRYTGLADAGAPWHKLGSQTWRKIKKKAQQAMVDVASELLEIYAKRAAKSGFAYPRPSTAYDDFAADFMFEETPDQTRAIDAVINDMQAEKPMDRLVCGDVGFGKTEVAMRAAFLAVEAGRQVLMLVPTTLLASQHYQTFCERFAEHPVAVESLSRLQSPAHERRVKKNLAEGRTDIVIGTHKLLHGAIKYQNLGLIIIDEEHRFGVRQKEKLKKLRTRADILTMSATPIPRTLNLALGALRDLSVIATPPPGRSAIATFVGEWDDAKIQEACTRETRRGGQIFFVHNDIDSIDKIAETLNRLLPDLSVRIAHGKMPADELRRVMRDFYHGRFQILVCTTIIETGIDIPNANTIFINEAEHFGLAQLHQLRGRVGRSHHKAYAHLMIKSFARLSADAKRRIESIESTTDLGAGFILASHDLEIRGAGELLGEKQSGKIHQLGFTLYHQLLAKTVAAVRQNHPVNFDEPSAYFEMELGIPCIIPADYEGDVHSRLVLYKRIANCHNNDDLRTLKAEVSDRFGKIPEATDNLFRAAALKILAQKIGIVALIIRDKSTQFRFGEKTVVAPDVVARLVQSQPKTYQLKNPHTLVVHQKMPENSKRLLMVENLLKMLQRRDG